MGGSLFLLVTNWVMRKTTKQSNGICWNFTTKLDDLDFADNLALISLKQTDLQGKSSKLESTADQVGLKARKTKVMRLNTQNTWKIQMQGEDLEEVDSFVYLGGTITTKGGCDEDIPTD
jgi:hypothetical protein